MDEKDYELLHALDETRNITHAADKLYMTQSALSKRIKALEQELGVEIVLRSRQGIRFTPAGEQVLLHSAAAAREMEKMRRQLASIQGEACGTLRAGISVNFSYYRLPEVLTEYHKAYPKVRLDIATGHSRNIYQQMLDSSLDVAVLRGEYPWDGTQFLLSQENICLICSEENKDRPISDYLYIDHSSDATISAQMARWRYENGVTNDAGNFVVDNIMVCREMVERGLGWALMPEVALDDFKGYVKPCTFENGEPFVRRTYIFCQRDAAALPQVQLFMDMLKKHRQKAPLRGEKHGNDCFAGPDAGCTGAPGAAPAGAAGPVPQASHLLYHEYLRPGKGFAPHPAGLWAGASAAAPAVSAGKADAAVSGHRPGSDRR